MFWKQLFATKSLEILQAEVKGENRLRRVLGPDLAHGGRRRVHHRLRHFRHDRPGRRAGCGTGRRAVIRGCRRRLLVRRSVLRRVRLHGPGGRQRLHLRLRHARRTARLDHRLGSDPGIRHGLRLRRLVVVEVSQRILRFFGDQCQVPSFLCSDPFSTTGAWFNLPALLITLMVTGILIVGIRESATANAILVAVKIGVVLFVLGAGIGYVSSANWNKCPSRIDFCPKKCLLSRRQRKLSRTKNSSKAMRSRHGRRNGPSKPWPVTGSRITKQSPSSCAGGRRHGRRKQRWSAADTEKEVRRRATEERHRQIARRGNPARRPSRLAPKKTTEKWGILGLFGLNRDPGIHRRSLSFAVHALRIGRHHFRRVDRILRLHRF